MKHCLKKFLVILLIIFTLNNFFITPVQAIENDVVSDALDVLEGLLGGVIGLLTLPERLIITSIGEAMNRFTASVAYLDGATSSSVNKDVITPFDILFNKVRIIDVNFFDISNSGATANSVSNKIRIGVASWYYVMRILASAILLVILIYVGIRMAISTIASDRAMYKKMLVDWVCSLALIFVLQYIIIFTITVNDAIVNAISLGVKSDEISNTFNEIEGIATRWFDIDSLAATIIYCMLVWQTLGLFISYFNRMLKTGFLIIISPLISLTYSIDKMGDGKAQALGLWLKEFVFTILIQPFHCAIYMCFVDVAFKLLVKNTGLSNARDSMATAIVAILCVKFVKEAEKIIRKIFAFKDDNSSTSMAAGLAISAMALSNAKNLGKGTRAAVNGVKNFGKGVAVAATTARVEAKAAHKLATDENVTSFSQAKEEVRTEMNNKKAEKINQKYGLNSKDTEKLSEDVKKRAEEIKSRKSGAISDKEAESQARLEIAKEGRTENGTIRRTISKAKGHINNAKEKLNSSATLKELGNLAKVQLSSGLGIMVGAGLYGTKGDLATAFASGAAVSAGTQEFMKSSTKTLTGTANKYLQMMDAQNGSDAQKIIDKIFSDTEDYSDTSKLEDKLDKLLQDIDKALDPSENEEGKRMSQKDKADIKNYIKTAPLEAPEKVSDILSKYANPDDNNITSSIKALNDFNCQNAIYTTAQNANDIGISQGAFTQSVVENFNSDSISQRIISQDKFNSSVVEKAKSPKVEETTENGSDSTNNDSDKERINNMTDGELNVLMKKFESEINAQASTLGQLMANGVTDQELIKQFTDRIELLKKEELKTISEALTNKERELTKLGVKMAEKCQQELSEIVKSTQGEEEKQINGMIKELKEISKNKDKKQ